jgi:hypothetical protein
MILGISHGFEKAIDHGEQDVSFRQLMDITVGPIDHRYDGRPNGRFADMMSESANRR